MLIKQFIRDFGIDQNYSNMSLQEFLEDQFSWVLRDVGWMSGTRKMIYDTKNSGQYNGHDVFTVTIKEGNSTHTLEVKVWKHPVYVNNLLAKIFYSWVFTQKEGNPDIRELYSVELKDEMDNPFLDRILSKVYSLRDKLYP